MLYDLLSFDAFLQDFCDFVKHLYHNSAALQNCLACKLHCNSALLKINSFRSTSLQIFVSIKSFSSVKFQGFAAPKQAI